VWVKFNLFCFRGGDMGQKFYFFTDPPLLSAQTPAQAYGPQNSTSFRVTNNHSTTAAAVAPVIAVCDGMICVQKISASHYSIILKPKQQPPLGLPPIKYFIYKGVDPTSLVSGNSIFASADVPFTERVNAAWDSKGGANPFSNSAGSLGLAFAANTTNPGAFEDDMPIDNFFYRPNPDFQLPEVKAGEKIGSFASATVEIGFEIVLEKLGHIATIGSARSAETVITVPNAGLTSAAPDNYDHFLHWHQKEASLAYMDPCAFFGSFSESKVFTKSAATESKCDSAQEIYDNILVKFQNKHKIYLDIRNDYGQSLNYFKDYGFDITLENGAGSTVALSTATSWPQYRCELSDAATAGEVKGNFFYTGLRLPKGQNNVPLVYLSRAFVKQHKKLKQKDKVQHPSRVVNGALESFIAPVKLSLPLIKDSSGADQFCCGYFKINYYDYDRSQQPTLTSLAPSKEFYLNGLFRPLDMTQTIMQAEGDLHFTIWHEEVLVSRAALDGPSYIASVGIANDQHNTTLLAFPEIYFSNGDNSDANQASIIWSTAVNISDEGFIQKIASCFTNKVATKRTVNLDDSSTVSMVVFEELQTRESEDRTLQTKQNIEDSILLQIGNAEFSDLISAVVVLDSFSALSNTYIESTEPYLNLDDTGKYYTKTNLNFSSNSQNFTILERKLLPLKIEVYSNGV
jgi:hypothetical protein